MMGARRPLVAPILALAFLACGAPPSRAAADEASAHHPGLRDQWQPQTEHDPRLAQPVRLEILGRAAGPALELLSKATGVALQVAPENLDTVGERKLTVIAQGCSLKSIMVQVPNALQECHWDVDVQRGQSVYLLHRNGGAEDTMVQLMGDDPRRREEAAGPQRAARVEAARQALAMSPGELAELAKTDPLLAAAVRDPDWRDRIEAFFALPQRSMDEFVATGETRMALAAAPERARATVVRVLRAKLADVTRQNSEGPKKGMLQPAVSFLSALLDRPEEAGLACRAPGLAEGWGGVALSVSAGAQTDLEAIPARAPSDVPPDEYDYLGYRDLLRKTGTEPGAVDAVLARLAERYRAEAIAERDRRRAAEWQEPSRPELRRSVTLPFQGPTEPAEVQRFMAQESGLSLVSDFFATWEKQAIPEEAKTAQPIWRLLYLLGESWFACAIDPTLRSASGYDWEQTGDCLVLHDRGWYYRVPQECLDSLFLAYRAKLQQQGQFGLDDAAAFMVELERRRPSRPELQRLLPGLPSDLVMAGLGGRGFPDSQLLRLYSQLAPRQRVKAMGPSGLPYTEMTPAQQELVRQASAAAEGEAPLPDKEITRAVCYVTRSDSARTVGVRFPSGSVEVTLELGPVPPHVVSPPGSDEPAAPVSQ